MANGKRNIQQIIKTTWKDGKNNAGKVDASIGTKKSSFTTLEKAIEDIYEYIKWTKTENSRVNVVGAEIINKETKEVLWTWTK